MRLIVAVNNKGYIGKDNKLMWKCREDMLHFKQLTTGGEIIVGRTTYEKCLGGRKLPNRNMYVVGTGYFTLPIAVATAITCGFMSNNVVWVIGGSEIYKQLLPICEEIHISHIDDDQEGDIKFELPKDCKSQVFNYYFKPDEENTRISTKTVESN